VPLKLLGVPNAARVPQVADPCFRSCSRWNSK